MSDSTRSLTVNAQRIQTLGISVLATIALGFALYFLRPVLLPFILAVFFVCGISPILDFIQRRWGVPRLVAVAITFLLGMALVTLLWLFIWVSVASLIEDADTYRDRLKSLTDRVSVLLDLSQPKAPDETKGELDRPSVAAEGQPDELSGYVTRNFQVILQNLSGALMDLMGSAVVVMIFMFFLLLGDTAQLERPQIWGEIEAKIRSYIVTKTLISFLTGVAVAVVLWLFGIPLAFVFGMLAFLLNFIPNVGPLVMCVLPLPLILLDPNLSVFGMVAAIALTSGIQFVSGNMIETKIMGDSFELHPVVVLLTLMLWGMIWGIPGMFLATPVTAAIKILLEKFDYTKPVADLMAGRFDSFAELIGQGSSGEEPEPS